MLYSLAKLWKYANARKIRPIPWPKYVRAFEKTAAARELRSMCLSHHHPNVTPTDLAELSRVFFPDIYAQIAFDDQLKKKSIVIDVYVKPIEAMIDIYFAACVDKNADKITQLLKNCDDGWSHINEGGANK
jgi:hypothetical protein